MRASLLACAALVLLGCDRRGYADYPEPPSAYGAPAYGQNPAYSPAATEGYAGWGTYPGLEAAIPGYQAPSGPGSWAPSNGGGIPGWGSYPGPGSAGGGYAVPRGGVPATGWQASGGSSPPVYGPALPPTSAGSHAARVAMSYQGRPYCWGGDGPDCFDCSGLTSSAWRAAGRRLPRTSEEQHEKLEPVAMNALEPGDVLWRPGHVGLYVGNGWAIHAPGTGKVVQYQPASKFVAAHRPR